ncbi:hypothetical protein SpCBS45565_g04990 [Spizellomyces sp. 'palustris']|nr:hypothetical protein SpCBS45565_g04990 [Spizellomyces sp. 'palustris']
MQLQELQWRVLLTCHLLFSLLPTVQPQPDSQIVNVALRVQRDLSHAVPINRVAGAGISLKDTILKGNYSLAALGQTERLVLNLVKRLVLDIYWDNRRKQWQVCPVAYPHGTQPQPAMGATPDEVILGNVTCSKVPYTVADIGVTIRQSLTSGQGSLNAVIVLVLNLHDLKVPIPADATVPTTFSTISQSLNSDGIFTPKLLAQFRSNLVANATSPYFIMSTDPATGKLTTPNGWPMGKLLIANGTQILVGFGENGLSAGSGYDPSVDQDVVFSAQEINGIPSVITTELNSDITSCAKPGATIAMNGTGFDVSDPRYSLQPSNATNGTSLSWSTWSFPYVVDTPSNPFTPAVVYKLVECGFQPLFLTNFSVEAMNASVWSWEGGQPSGAHGLDCAVVKRNTGRWAVDRCQTALPVACQRLPPNATQADPYDWIIVNNRKIFEEAVEACQPPYVFNVPRTAQENAALADALRATDITKAWINLNQVLPTCWVAGWQSKCPYDVKDANPQAIIGATLKQGIVIILIFSIFLFFKCRRQLRVSRLNKRKTEVRRKIRQNDYVTVPA